MKTVFPNRMVAHVWAQQNQAHGRGSSFFFEGPTIYSYGKHFPIAKFVRNAAGERAVEFTTRGYSMSTSRHIGYARNALRDDTRILWVTTPGESHHRVRDEAQETINRTYYKLVKAQTRYRPKHLAVIELARDQANAYAEFHGHEWRVELPAMDEAAILGMRAALKAAAEIVTERRRRAELDRMKEDTVKVAEWRAFKRDNCPRVFEGGMLLRIMRDAVNAAYATVETSAGAEVPLTDARLAIQYWRLHVDKRMTFPESDPSARFDIGQFRLDSIRIDGTLVAGCHTFTRAELERFEKSLEEYDHDSA